MRKQYTAEQRERLMSEVRGGERVSVVAKRLGVTVSSAYLWMKEAVPAPSTPLFARVVPTRVTSLRVEVGGAALILENGFDADLLRQVVAALSGSL